jgi:NAD(P)H-dependent FMN reductase
MPDIVLLCGTNRPDANSRIVSGIIADCYAATGANVTRLDLAGLPPEIFDPASYAGPPPAFKAFTDPILASGGLHIVTPEYNGSLPGVLKYFIDMLPFPESFQDRCACFTGVSAGGGGALRPIEQLVQIFHYREGIVCPARVLLPGITDLLDEGGNLTDGKMRQRLQRQAQVFTDFVAALKG